MKDAATPTHKQKSKEIARPNGFRSFRLRLLPYSHLYLTASGTMEHEIQSRKANIPTLLKKLGKREGPRKRREIGGKEK